MSFVDDDGIELFRPKLAEAVNPSGSFLLDMHSHLPIEPLRSGPHSVGTQVLLGYDHLTG